MILTSLEAVELQQYLFMNTFNQFFPGGEDNGYNDDDDEQFEDEMEDENDLNEIRVNDDLHEPDPDDDDHLPDEDLQ